MLLISQASFRITQPKMFSRGSQRPNYSIACGYFNHALGVVSLNHVSSPAAIFFVITFLAVNTIKRCVRRPRPHVLKKGKEITFPSIANSDSSPAVHVVLIASRCKATILHMRPYLVFALMKLSAKMLGERFLHALDSIAPATHLSFEQGATDDASGPAVTQALPSKQPVASGGANCRFRSCNDGQLIYALAD